MPKRKHGLCDSNVSQNTRSKKPKLNKGLRDNTRNYPWIKATGVYNYMLNDPLIDWLESDHQTSTGTRSRSDSSVSEAQETFENFLMNQGIAFEDKVINFINANVCPVVKVAEHYSAEGVEKTKELLRSGVPVLHSAPLANTKNNTYGVADLIVRSDYITKIIPNGLTEEILQSFKTGCCLSPDYHYVIIDVKFSTLPLNCQGLYLLNQGSYPAYKAQIWIYTQALNSIQRYMPQYGFVLGRRWRYTSKGVKFSNFSCLDRLGVIEFSGYDLQVINKTKKALKWCREVKTNGYKWTTSPPSKKELYPNMCKDSGKWNGVKKVIANQIGEITSVWMCGPRNRDTAFKNGFRSWRNPNLKSEDLGIGGKRGEIINSMLKINRQSVVKVLPSCLKENTFAWKSTDNEVFVDFETFTDVFSDFTEMPYQKPKNLIYHIGVGWFGSDGNWKYRYFIAQKPTNDEEYRIMKEFVDFLKEKGNPAIYYWHAEKNFWNSACNKQFERSDIDEERKECIIDWGIDYQLKDLRKLFVDNKVVIKDCFGYGLKEIGKCLKKHELISTPLESECSNGRTAMIQAWRAYKRFEKPCKSGIMKDVTQYNEYDCRLLGDILTYLRRHHQ